MFGPARVSLVVFPALLALLSCGTEPSGPFVETLLLDENQPPDVLTESGNLEAPPSLTGNRFLQGWRASRSHGGKWLDPQPGARVQGVQLLVRPRDLALQTQIVRAQEDAVVSAHLGDRFLGSFPLTSPLEIELPEDLGLGRFTIELDFPEDSEVLVNNARFRQAAPAGKVEIEGEAVVQAGTSMVDFVRRIPAGATLVGDFDPPEDAESDQLFSLLVETSAGRVSAWKWRRGLLSSLRGTRDFEIPISTEAGWVRIRLLAEGQGPSGRWASLRIRTPKMSSAVTQSAPESGLEAPRLVVLYVMDALRADALGHLGGVEGVSPHLDELAEQGRTFVNHLSVAPNTLPSTKSLMTGQPYWLQGGFKLSPEGPETLAELFSNRGFRTAVFSGNPYVSQDFGTTRGFAENGTDWILETEEDSYNSNAERVQIEALRWLDSVGPQESAFVYLHTLNPHNPYQPPEPFLSRFAEDEGSSIDGSTKTLQDIKQFRVPLNQADEKRIEDLYAGSVSYADAQLGRLRAKLESRYDPGEVLLIVTSDHGEELFDHRGVLHGYTLYEEMLRIPMIFWWSDRLTPGRIEAATDNLDLHETLRELIGASSSGRGTGRSLWPLVQGESTREIPIRFAAASSVRGGIFMASSDRYKVVWAPRKGYGWGMGEGRGRTRDPEYLFDLENDPGETRNLLGEDPLEAGWLRSQLLAWVEQGKALESGATAEKVVVEGETRERLRALGYLN